MGGRGGRGGGATVFTTIKSGGRTVNVWLSESSRSIGDGFTRHSIDLTVGTNIVGQMQLIHNTKTGTLGVRSVQVVRQGAGLGGKLYEHAISKGRSLGAKVFASDERVSVSAARVWKSLGKKHTVTTHAHTRSDVQLTSKTGGPVFSIDLK